MIRRAGAFTLIELLVVVTIMVLLLTLLMPAILKAGQVARKIATEAQVKAIANSCEAYYMDFQAYPGVISNTPDNSGGSPSKITGSQNLRLSLIGCSRSGSSLTRQYQGPADDMDSYSSSAVRKYEAHYTAGTRELASHGSISLKNGDSSYNGNIEMFVDYRLTPTRPILYYRARPRYANDQLFEFDDNEEYCLAGKGENSAAFGNMLGGTARPATTGFLLISAGADRIFFTDDDITNIGG